ncbi:unnamed protein product [Menidia menidia]|uniref:(Atlantic silverside) hypothetical protein n=1 Tax=Menidia menidia TaxID=238744 RepID=A0A8S4BKV1_9TELE|nr:unnamed protein product [Menidia menidia]
MNWELETSSSYGLKQEKQLSAPHRRYYSFCRRKSFAAFVASKRIHPEEGASWSCCGQTFKEHSAVHKHVARTHNAEVQELTRTTFKQFLTQMEEKAETQRPSGPKAEPVDISAWIPEISHISEEQLKSGPGKVLLYYRYCQVEDPQAVCEWQKALCEKLHLTGKVSEPQTDSS